MTGNHHRFEFLCVLADSQELTEPQEAALRRHAQDCIFCRDRIREMTQLKSHLLLTRACNDRGGRLPEGMRERFIARALVEGVPLTSSSAIGVGKLGLAGTLLGALLLLAAVVNAGLPPVPDTPPRETARAQAPPQAADSAIFSLPGGKNRALRRKAGWTQSHAIPRTTPPPRYPRIFPSRAFSVSVAPDHSFLVVLPPFLDRGNASLDTRLRSRFESGPFLSQSAFVFATTTVSALNPSLDFAVATPPRTFQFSGYPKSYFVQGKAWETR